MRIFTLLIAALIPTLGLAANRVDAPFNGAVATGFVGWDFMHVDGSPNWPSPHDGSGLFGGGGIGYGRTLCNWFYLEGRIAYRAYANDRLLIKATPDFEASRFVKQHGGYIDAVIGLIPCWRWLGYLIVGGEANHFRFVRGLDPVRAPLSDQKQWMWGPRIGVGLQRMMDCRLSLGAEYAYSYSDRKWSQHKDDPARRRFKSSNHQIALSVNYRL